MPQIDNEDEWELREVRRPKGTHRSRSTETPGADRELLREDGTNRNLGPSESRSVDDAALRQRYQGDPIYLTPEGISPTMRELSPGQKLLAEVTDFMLREVVAPVIHDVVHEVVLPTAKTKLSEFTERRRSKASERADAKARTPAKSEADVIYPLAAESDSPSVGVDGNASLDSGVDVAEPVLPMRRSDLLAIQLQLKFAEEIAARQRWLLAHAVVDDEDLSPELGRMFATVLGGGADDLTDDEHELITEYLHRANGPAIERHELLTDL
jgi:hypothetical protein